MFDFLGDKALIILSILFVVLAIFAKSIFEANIELRGKLQKERELHAATIEAYKRNKELDTKLQELKEQTQIKKDDASLSHTKLKVEIAKRGEIKEVKRDENSNSDDDFVHIYF